MSNPASIVTGSAVPASTMSYDQKPTLTWHHMGNGVIEPPNKIGKEGAPQSPTDLVRTSPSLAVTKSEETLAIRNAVTDHSMETKLDGIEAIAQAVLPRKEADRLMRNIRNLAQKEATQPRRPSFLSSSYDFLWQASHQDRVSLTKMFHGGTLPDTVIASKGKAEFCQFRHNFAMDLDDYIYHNKPKAMCATGGATAFCFVGAILCESFGLNVASKALQTATCLSLVSFMGAMLSDYIPVYKILNKIEGGCGKKVQESSNECVRAVNKICSAMTSEFHWTNIPSLATEIGQKAGKIIRLPKSLTRPHQRTSPNRNKPDGPIM